MRSEAEHDELLSQLETVRAAQAAGDYSSLSAFEDVESGKQAGDGAEGDSDAEEALSPKKKKAGNAAATPSGDAASLLAAPPAAVGAGAASDKGSPSVGAYGATVVSGRRATPPPSCGWVRRSSEPRRRKNKELDSTWPMGRAQPLAVGRAKRRRPQ